MPAEYMAAYGRENGYVMSFAGLLLIICIPEISLTLPRIAGLIR